VAAPLKEAGARASPRRARKYGFAGAHGGEQTGGAVIGPEAPELPLPLQDRACAAIANDVLDGMPASTGPSEGGGSMQKRKRP
jgi:hypothetical protein